MQFVYSTALGDSVDCEERFHGKKIGKEKWSEKLYGSNNFKLIQLEHNLHVKL